MRSTSKCDIITELIGSFVSMKTKIIYISGNEVFDMNDIRAAFEEVRNTLGLDKNTILFGVPVDSDSAFSLNETQKNTPDNTVKTSDKEKLSDEINDSETPIEKKLKETAKKTQTRSTVKNIDSEISSSSNVSKEESVKEKVVPILSVLSVKNEEKQKIADDNEIESETSKLDVEKVIEPDVPETAADESKSDAERVTIDDIIASDAPNEPIEKTLEQLLESMTPLREDVTEENISEPTTEPEIEIDETSAEFSTEESDATLEQLAAEFAENEDKIASEKKPENHSKIGKLKNILPFKKAKREDSGIMGDLFGWAGIAANDEEISIPGFFTNAASKK